MNELRCRLGRRKIAVDSGASKSHRHAGLALGLLFLATLVSCGEPDRQQKSLRGATMGTGYSIQFVSTDIDADSVRAAIEPVLAEIDRQMSTWRDDSDISRFNASASVDWVNVPPEMAFVANQALQVAELSRGAFDVTVSPLVELWGFGRGEPVRAPPDESQLQRVAELVGYRHLRVRVTEPVALRKTIPGLQVDFSALAKGYAVDRIAEYLLSQDVNDFLVDIGGELRVSGRNAKGHAWRIGIEQPTSSGTEIELAFTPGVGGVATSGDYRNFYLWQGKRYSHVLDPRTARPVDHALASVTVVAETAMLADAWATALLVLGTESALRVAESLDIATYLVERVNDGYVARHSTRFVEYLAKEGG